MILTVTLNPSLDLHLFLTELSLGKVHRSERELVIPGGKGINISRVLRIFNEETFILGFSGGMTGRILEEELSKRNIPYEFVKINGSVRFAVGIVETNNNRPMTVINGRGPKIDDNNLLELKEKFCSLVERSQIVVLSGSIPPSISENIYFDLMEMSKEYKAIRVLDARGKALELALKSTPDIIKPNQEEAEELLGYSLNSRKNLIKAGEYFNKMGIKYALISLGERGAILSFDEGVFWAKMTPLKGYNWGAGDAFLAGFLVGFKREKDPLYALRLATATAYVKLKKLELEENDTELIYELINDVEIKKI
ncbi:MAG: 1-phosphofructokinase [Dictyoglomus sp. NZ13-RE01]|nr:MAG: 1-phosphofructokinase [Dictyoglomus sp. NZ13-RE01]